MAVLPAEIPTGLVTGQYYFVNADNVDSGTDPDLTVVTGIVKLTCQAKKPLRMPTKKATVIPMVFECEFDSVGRLVPKGRTEIGVEVPASSSNLFNPKDFTWLVEFELRDALTGFTINLEPFSIYVNEGVENDLTMLAPVDSSPGTIVIQGATGTPGAASTVPGPTGVTGVGVDQLDYVAALASRSKSTTMQLKKTDSTGAVEVSCITPSGSHVTYQFYGSAAGDDYRVLANVWAGTSTLSISQASKRVWADATSTGTYTENAGAFIYTLDKATPATFTTTATVDVAGSELRFHTYRDNRGGIWQLTIDGPASYVMDVSTYDPVAAYDTAGSVLVTGLPVGTYTVKGTFLGDDPDNAPTGGISRGWLANNTDTNSATFLSVYSPFRAINKDLLLKPASNMDIAMQVKPQGGPTLEWIPYHAIATAFQADAPVFLDGDTVIDVAAMATNQYRTLRSFELVQRVFGRNTSGGATNLIELATSQIIRPSGQVTVSGKWKALADITLGDNYVMMFPASMVLFDQLATSIGNKYVNNAGLIGTETALVAENDTAISHLFLSSTNKNIAAAVRYNNVGETLRRGKANKNSDATKAFLQHRDASIVKLYNRPYAPTTNVAAGTVNRFSGDYLYSQGTGLFDQLSL